MMKTSQHNKRKIENLPLIGKTKAEIINLLGDEFNFYPDKVWYYIVSKTWYGRKKVLYLEFENDVVTRKSELYNYKKK